MKHRLLIVAFHVPPVQGGSGVHRMLSYARFLPESGWDVKILTVTPKAYQATSSVNLAEIPEKVEVVRAPALDAARHLSVRGRYPRLMALPDRWQTWIISGIWKGSGIVRQWMPTAMLSTFPIASAHAVALGLSKKFRIPWVADFRDPMAMPDYPDDPLVRRSYWWLEKRVLQNAAHVTVATKGIYRLYCERYGRELDDRISVISNGFDESLFPDGKCQQDRNEHKADVMRIVHSGLVYSFERDPSQLFIALAELRDEGKIDSGRVCFVFRASGYSKEFDERFGHLKLEGLVKFEDEPLPYRMAIKEMINADALLVLQGAICNMQIPAKVYEYLATGRPVLALTDAAGDTSNLMKSLGCENILQIDNKSEIKKKLPIFMDRLRNGLIDLPQQAEIKKLSRRSRTKEIARILEMLT